MSNKKSRFSVLSFLCFSLLSCNSHESKDLSSSTLKKHKEVTSPKVKPTTIFKEVPFDTLLNEIDKKILGVWDPPIRMEASEYFSALYQNPEKYCNHMIKTISNKKVSESKKMICVFATQKMDLDDYITFSEKCLNLFKKRLVSEEVFSTVLFPFGWKTKLRFAEHANNVRVKRLLKATLDSKKLTRDAKIIINHMYNGEMWKEHLEGLEIGQPPE